MNRRRFIQSLAAVVSLPAGVKLPVPSLVAAAPAGATAAVTAVPAQARFWAIYISALHGECTPQTLQNMLHIPEGDAKKYIGQLVSDGIIKPSPLLQKSASRLLKKDNESLVDKVKNRLKKKSQARHGGQEPAQLLEAETEIQSDNQSEDENERARVEVELVDALPNDPLETGDDWGPGPEAPEETVEETETQTTQALEPDISPATAVEHHA